MSSICSTMWRMGACTPSHTFMAVGEPDVGNPHVRFDEGCALKAQGTQPPAMAAGTKPSQQSGTESCVVRGKPYGEA